MATGVLAVVAVVAVVRVVAAVAIGIALSSWSSIDLSTD